MTWDRVPEYLHLCVCATPAQEAAHAVRLVRKLTADEGLRYREIALVVGDLDRYVPLLKRELEEAGMPYFTDRRESLAQRPALPGGNGSAGELSAGGRDPAGKRTDGAVCQEPSDPPRREPGVL